MNDVLTASAELAAEENKLAQAALDFAAAYFTDKVFTDEGMERMLAAREALFEAYSRVDLAETVWHELNEGLCD